MNRNRFKYLRQFKGLVIVLGPLWCASGVLAQDNTGEQGANLTFTSWTGPYMRSQMLGFVRPYEKENGVRVDVKHYNGGINEIRDQVESANVIWDVVDLTQADSLRACDEGLLEDISTVSLPNGNDGTNFKEDFVEGALNTCGVGVIVWATAFAYNNNIDAKTSPSSISDFFDTKKYPGPRAIRKDPTVIMEWALMADGVARDDVYALLETPEGVERAFKKMDAIRPGLKLWSSGREPVRLLNNDDVVMSMVWATTGAVAAKESGSDFSIIWDGRVIELDLFGIVKGSRNKAAAVDFIRYASSSKGLASMVGHLPNGPTRKSSLSLLSDEVLAQIPNGPAYKDMQSIRSNAQWWSTNHSMLEETFNAWLQKSGRQGASGTVR